MVMFGILWVDFFSKLNPVLCVTYLKVMQHFGTSIIWRLLKQDNSVYSFYLVNLMEGIPFSTFMESTVNHW